MDDRLYRSTTDRPLAGVCGGLAAWLGIDPSFVRIAWVLISLASGGLFVLVYLVMAVVVPDAPPGWAPRGRMQSPGGPGGWPSGQQWGPGAPGAPGGWGSANPAGGPPGAPPAGGWGASAPGGAWTGAPGSPTQPPRPDVHWPGDQAAMIAGVVLVIVGAWLLVRDYIPINWDLVWPIGVIALGALLISGAVRRGR